ncbi:unnamed protein product [Eruca vesicaria subsp. sativa]|uniref:FHA domain-containing protein n=1 Tax=Eruca vesicaria subsp. sativa TaxID=29727 RepID=A0ABC8J4T7_ERUVS|nr:unnamed protein product [Eruca vesicaria subsp. sativa]
MTPPLLKLAFVQGPRNGETLEYKPGSTIRIGRVVRGNEIAIKDAGISTKHLRIVSDSENWIIHDLGSSNGTVLNSKTLEEDTPVNLRHGDLIKLGECTSIVVNFETDVQEHKLPPRPRRNNKRLPVSGPDPVESVQEKHEPPKRTKVGRPRKNKKEEEEAVSEERRRSFRAQGCKSLGLDSRIKLEVEETPKEVKISAIKRGTRSRLIQNVESEDSALEEMGIPSRATRSRRKEIGGDSYLELDMVLRQARANKKKKMEQKSLVEEIEATNEDEKGRSETSDKENERVVEQVESESRNRAVVGEEDLNCSVRKDGETENLQEEKDSKGEEGGVETSDGRCDNEERAGQGSRNEKKDVEKVDLEKMTLGDWFKYMEVYLRKKIVDDTEEKIEAMRAKSLRVHQYIAEQKQAKGNGGAS